MRRYDIRDASLTRCKSDISHLNLPRGTKTLLKSGKKGDAENARPENDGQKLRGLENAGVQV